MERRRSVNIVVCWFLAVVMSAGIHAGPVSAATAESCTITAFVGNGALPEKQAAEGIRLDGFIFMPETDDNKPILMAHGSWERVTIVDSAAVRNVLGAKGNAMNEQGLLTDRIEAYLRNVRTRLAGEKMFETMAFDPTIEIEYGAYRSAALTVARAGDAGTLTLNWHDFRDEDFLYITVKSVLMADTLKRWSLEEGSSIEKDPALRQLYVLIYCNVREFMKRISGHPDRARILMRKYADVASPNRGLYQQYAYVLEQYNTSVINATDMTYRLAMMMASEKEKVYYRFLRTDMHTIVNDPNAMPLYTFSRLKLRMQEMDRQVHDRIYGYTEAQSAMQRTERTVSDIIRDSRYDSAERQRSQRIPETLISLADRRYARTIPQIVKKTFGSFEQFVDYRMLDDGTTVFVRVRLPQPDGTEKYAHLCLGVNDNTDTVLGSAGHIFGLTLGAWMQRSANAFRYANGVEETDVDRKRTWLEKLSLAEMTRTISSNEKKRQACREAITRLKTAVYGEKKYGRGQRLSTIADKMQYRPRSVKNLKEAEAALYEIRAWYNAPWLKERYPKFLAGIIAMHDKRYDAIAMWPVVREKAMTSAESIRWIVPGSTSREPVWYASGEKMSLRDICAYLRTLHVREAQTELFANDVNAGEVLGAA